MTDSFQRYLFFAQCVILTAQICVALDLAPVAISGVVWLASAVSNQTR